MRGEQAPSFLQSSPAADLGRGLLWTCHGRTLRLRFHSRTCLHPPLCLKRVAFFPSKSPRSLMLPAPSWMATVVRHPGLLAVAWLSLGTWTKLTAVAESGAPGRGSGEAQGVPGQGCIWGGGSQPPQPPSPPPSPHLTSALLPGSSRGVRGEGHRTMSGRFPSEPFLCRERSLCLVSFVITMTVIIKTVRLIFWSEVEAAGELPVTAAGAGTLGRAPRRREGASRS